MKQDTPQTNNFELSLIIPFYNESRRIGGSVESLSKFLNSTKLNSSKDIEIIYVDDGSTDNTIELLKKELFNKKLNNPNLHFVQLPKNRGKGHAIKNGMLRANGRFSLYTDFDFAISLDEVDKFLKTIKDVPSQRGAIIASRRADSIAIKKQSPMRKILGRGFHSIMKMIINIPVKDTQCGFKLFDSQTSKHIFSKTTTRGFAFDVEVLKRALDLNVPIIEKGVRITHDDKYSTVNMLLDPFKMIWDLIKLKFKLFMEKK